jgi:hypothetical protein
MPETQSRMMRECAHMTKRKNARRIKKLTEITHTTLTEITHTTRREITRMSAHALMDITRTTLTEIASRVRILEIFWYLHLFPRSIFVPSLKVERIIGLSRQDVVGGRVLMLVF